MLLELKPRDHTRTPSPARAATGLRGARRPHRPERAPSAPHGGASAGAPALCDAKLPDAKLPDADLPDASFPPVAPPRATAALWRCLPAAVVATLLVIVAPAVLVAVVFGRGGLATTVVSAVAAIAISLALAAAGAALWKRLARSRDVVFADLMVWGWLRRYNVERRLSQARELFESARKAGPTVNIELLLGLSRLLQARDPYIHGHSQRVSRYAGRIGRAMGLSAQEVAKLRTAAEVHDVGKIYTPRAILNNPEPLTDAEFAEIKLHARRGAEMLSVVGDAEITAMVRHHHERIDGRGYPDGLAGAAIPLGARIIAVADTFDAITSDRPYRKAGSQKRALAVLAAEGGAQLDADAVAAFKQGYSSTRSVAWYAFAATAAGRATAALQSAISNLGLGASSAATLVPALGAAGVLAVSPGLLRASHDGRRSDGSASSLSQPLHIAGLDSSPGGPAKIQAGRAPGGAGSPRANIKPPVPRAGIHAPARLRQLSPAVASPTAAANADGGAGASGSRAGSTSQPSSPSPPPQGGSPLAHGPTVGVPAVPAPATPPVTPPSITAPSVSTPTVSTPAVTTPSVNTPVGTVPSVTAPSVTVPSATVPAVSVPSR